MAVGWRSTSKTKRVSHLPDRYPEAMEKNMHERRDNAVDMPLKMSYHLFTHLNQQINLYTKKRTFLYLVSWVRLNTAFVSQPTYDRKKQLTKHLDHGSQCGSTGLNTTVSRPKPCIHEPKLAKVLILGGCI